MTLRIIILKLLPHLPGANELKQKLQHYIFERMSPSEILHSTYSMAGCYALNICNTVRCRYNAVNFLQNPHNRHPIARP